MIHYNWVSFLWRMDMRFVNRLCKFQCVQIMLLYLILNSYETRFIKTLIKIGKHHLAKAFNLTSNILTLCHLIILCSDYIGDIWDPVELEGNATLDDYLVPYPLRTAIYCIGCSQAVFILHKLYVILFIL